MAPGRLTSQTGQAEIVQLTLRSMLALTANAGDRSRSPLAERLAERRTSTGCQRYADVTLTIRSCGRRIPRYERVYGESRRSLALTEHRIRMGMLQSGYI